MNPRWACSIFFFNSHGTQCSSRCPPSKTETLSQLLCKSYDLQGLKGPISQIKIVIRVSSISEYTSEMKNNSSFHHHFRVQGSKYSVRILSALNYMVISEIY